MRQLEHDLEVRTCELAEKTLQKTVLDAKNKKHYLRDKLRVLSSWHMFVLRTKNSFHKANTRRLLLRSKLAAASFHSCSTQARVTQGAMRPLSTIQLAHQNGCNTVRMAAWFCVLRTAHAS
jgi:hypothetical protein